MRRAMSARVFCVHTCVRVGVRPLFICLCLCRPQSYFVHRISQTLLAVLYPTSRQIVTVTILMTFSEPSNVLPAASLSQRQRRSSPSAITRELSTAAPQLRKTYRMHTTAEYRA